MGLREVSFQEVENVLSLGKNRAGRAPWSDGYVRYPKSPPTRAEYDAADLIIGMGVGLLP